MLECANTTEDEYVNIIKQNGITCNKSVLKEILNNINPIRSHIK